MQAVCTFFTRDLGDSAFLLFIVTITDLIALGMQQLAMCEAPSTTRVSTATVPESRLVKRARCEVLPSCEITAALTVSLAQYMNQFAPCLSASQKQ